IHYLNSGDWIDSLSALVEDIHGNWDILYYDKRLVNEQKETELLEEVV
ncbi:MAG: UDP-2,3-diacylglucosamine diphosphatase, partial [Bacteroidales bacterium]|nr:UDP-2,3-diacylglucosamine diphosphatase [Bacteroidales bacterium]